MWIVRLALRRPYTFVVLSILIFLLGIGSAIEAPKDVFPYIDIPVVTIVWTYSGLTPNEMEGPRRHCLRARPHDDRQRYRALRVRVLPGRLGHQGLLPADRQG